MRSSSGLSFLLTFLLAVALQPLTALADGDAPAEPEQAIDAAAEKASEQGAKQPSQGPTSSERGRVVAIDADSLAVKLDLGPRTRYERIEETVVRGRKQSWSDLRAGDEVRVRLRGLKLQIVVVLPSTEELAERERVRQEAVRKYREAAKAKAAAGKNNNQAK